MKGSPKSGAEENTFIKAYEDLERSTKNPMRGSEAYPLLEIVHGPKQGAWYTVAYQKEITLGRAATNSIVLEDNSVSRSHAVLQYDGEEYTVRDIGSRNGTFLNGKKILEETTVHHMGIIKVGIYTLRFLQEPTDQVYEMEIKEEHTPRVEDQFVAPTVVETPPEISTTTEAPSEEEYLPELVREKSPEERTLNEDLGNILGEEVISPATAPKKPSRALRNLLTLLLVFAFLGGGGYLAYRLGALEKLKSYLGGTGPSKVAKKEVAPEVNVIKPTQAPPATTAGQVIPVFLEADAQPIPAKVFYKGNELGVTPFKISVQVPVGKPEELSAEFFLENLNQKWTERATIQVTKQDEVVPVKFQPQWGQLKVAALPKDGQLFLEGRFDAGPTELKPMKLENLSFGTPIFLPYGKYIAEIRQQEALGDSSSMVTAIRFRREFELNANSPSFEISASDEAIKTFPAQINSDPAGAELLVDGKKLGTTPFKGDLPTGRHKLVLKKEGFNDFEKEISIELNTPYSANYNLNTTTAGGFINKGRDFLKKGLYNESIEQLAEALKQNPEPTELAQIHLLLGKNFIQTKTYDQALAYFQRAKENPEYTKDADLGIAEAYVGLGQSDQALVKLIDLLINTKDEKIRSDVETLYHKISPLKSVIYVATQPTGAAVLVNGNPIGQTTPVILSDLMVGSYRIGIQKDGFQNYETRVTVGVSSMKPLIVKMDPKKE